MQRPFTSGSRQAPDPFDQFLEQHNYYRKHTARDASCLFRVISEQLYDTQMHHYAIRKKCIVYMRKHRDFFQPLVDRDLDEYLDDLISPRTRGTLLELRAAGYLFERNVLLFEPFDLGNYCNGRAGCCFNEVFRVFYTPEHHFDSVFTADYMRAAAMCQALTYEILYKDVFQLPDVNFAVEQMLHPVSFDLENCSTENNAAGYCTRMELPDGRAFDFDLPDQTKCILENHKLCHFHYEDFPNFSHDLQRDMKARNAIANRNGLTDRNALHRTAESLLPEKHISCVRQLLNEGITPFPYKVAKGLDPNMYRNVEFDVWSEARREAKLQNWYHGDSNFKVGAKCHVQLQKSSGSDVYTAHIQEIGVDKRYCVVYIEQLGEKRLVPYESLIPLPVEQFKPWALPYRVQRNMQRYQQSMRCTRHYNYRMKFNGQFSATHSYCAPVASLKSELCSIADEEDLKQHQQYATMHESNCLYKLKQFTHLENFHAHAIEYCTMPLTVDHVQDPVASEMAVDSSQQQIPTAPLSNVEAGVGDASTIDKLDQQLVDCTKTSETAAVEIENADTGSASGDAAMTVVPAVDDSAVSNMSVSEMPLPPVVVTTAPCTAMPFETEQLIMPAAGYATEVAPYYTAYPTAPPMHQPYVTGGEDYYGYNCAYDSSTAFTAANDTCIATTRGGAVYYMYGFGAPAVSPYHQQLGATSGQYVQAPPLPPQPSQPPMTTGQPFNSMPGSQQFSPVAFAPNGAVFGRSSNFYNGICGGGLGAASSNISMMSTAAMHTQNMHTPHLYSHNHHQYNSTNSSYGNSSAANTFAPTVRGRNYGHSPAQGGHVNWEARRSVKSNGSDLPTDMATLRYFYNLGLEYYKKQPANGRDNNDATKKRNDNRETEQKITGKLQNLHLDENGNNREALSDSNNNTITHIPHGSRFNNGNNGNGSHFNNTNMASSSSLSYQQPHNHQSHYHNHYNNKIPLLNIEESNSGGGGAYYTCPPVFNQTYSGGTKQQPHRRQRYYQNKERNNSYNRNLTGPTGVGSIGSSGVGVGSGGNGNCSTTSAGGCASTTITGTNSGTQVNRKTAGQNPKQPNSASPACTTNSNQQHQARNAASRASPTASLPKQSTSAPPSTSSSGHAEQVSTQHPVATGAGVGAAAVVPPVATIAVSYDANATNSYEVSQTTTSSCSSNQMKNPILAYGGGYEYSVDPYASTVAAPAHYGGGSATGNMYFQMPMPGSPYGLYATAPPPPLVGMQQMPGGSCAYPTPAHSHYGGHAMTTMAPPTHAHIAGLTSHPPPSLHAHTAGGVNAYYSTSASVDHSYIAADNRSSSSDSGGANNGVHHMQCMNYPPPPLSLQAPPPPMSFYISGAPNSCTVSSATTTTVTGTGVGCPGMVGQQFIYTPVPSYSSGGDVFYK